MKIAFVPVVAALSFAAHAQAPQQQDFAWRAPVDVPAGASLARIELPPGALARLQSRQADDVRIFNAAGEAVPFAWISTAAPAPGAEEKTQPWAALPIYSLPAGARRAKGSVQVRVGGSQPVWVKIDGTPASEPDAKPLDAVLFDTREQKKPISAIEIDAAIPANTPVQITVSASRDLAQWTPVPVRGRIYRFDGNRAPVNFRLAFDQPLDLEKQYLRVDWAGQAISVTAINGVIAPPGVQPRRVRTPLPAGREAAPDAIEIDTGFATPLAGIALSTPQANTLLPVRVLGRNNNTQPWVVLAQGVVYRLADSQGGEAMTNPPIDLRGASVRQLRVISTNGAPLAPAKLAAEAEFAPRQAVFVAGGSPPFTVAAGRENTLPAALPAATLTGMLGARKVDELPQATLGPAVEAPPPAQGWLPGIANRTVALWAILLIGVAVLGGVAWSLMRQMKETGGNNVKT